MQTQLEQPERSAQWAGTIPATVDARILGLVVVTAALAASVNLPYGGLPLAVTAFALLSATGGVAHYLGERKLRRLTVGLVERWVDAGGQIEAITCSGGWNRTEWTIHTPDGKITVGGLALVPIARLTIEWDGLSDSMDADEAETNLDAVAEELYEELFEIGTATRR